MTSIVSVTRPTSRDTLTVDAMFGSSLLEVFTCRLKPVASTVTV